MPPQEVLTLALTPEQRKAGLLAGNLTAANHTKDMKNGGAAGQSAHHKHKERSGAAAAGNA